MTNTEFCEVRDIGRVRLVSINRPASLNAITTEASHELGRVWDDFQHRDNLWVGVITGVGDKAFCVGNDLKVQAAGKRGKRPESGSAGLTSRFDLTKPMIAAVNGYALGAGFEIALACDIIIASENAIFALPEPKHGMIAGAGGIHRLVRAIPFNRAMEIILTARHVTAEEGHRLGFVNEVVPMGSAVTVAMQFAARIIECAPIAIRASKEAAHSGMREQTLEKAIRTCYPTHQAALASDDFLEGPRAFAERRKAIWSNR